MAVRRNYAKDRRIGMFRGLRVTRSDNITVSGASAATIGTKILKPYGYSQINSTGTGGPHKYGLPAPGFGAIGTEKRITINPNATSVDVAIINTVNATKFWGSTANAILTSTACKQAITVELVAVSSAQWAVVSNPGSTAGAFKSRQFTLVNQTS